jgi:lipoprotein-releasing system permease protein
MTIIEKKKDISILRAVGGSGKFIQRIYLYEGLFVGFIGSIFGGLLGLALCYGQIAFKWFKIDNTKYIMDAIPILINYSDVIAVVLLSFVLSIIATIYPAWKSSKINLIESLREE